MYEKAIVDLQKQLRAVNQELMESKRKLSDTAVELKKSKSSSSEAVMGQFKCTIEDLTHERDHYYQECERSKFLLSDMKKIETELKSKKNFVKQLRKEVENKTKEITSLNGTVRRKDRELAKAKQEVLFYPTFSLFFFTLYVWIHMYLLLLCDFSYVVYDKFVVKKLVI